MMIHSRTGYADASGMQESKDCVVRALSVAAGIPYANIHAELKLAGRRDRKGTPIQVTEKVMSKLFPLADRRYFERRISLSQFIAWHKTGRYLLFTSSHALALCEGVVYDWKSHPRCRIKWAWKLS